MNDKTIKVSAVDLEKLLFAIGALKKIEHAINAQIDDPLIPSQASITAAHDRLAKEWRNQTRVNEDPVYDQPLTVEEHKVLNILTMENHPNSMSADELKLYQQIFDQNHLKLENTTVSNLRRKGMLELGTYFQIVKWADTGEVEQTSEKNILHRLTMRGKMALGKLN